MNFYTRIMKKLLTILLFLLPISGVLAQKVECRRFHTGVYKLVDSGTANIVIERTKSKQIETYGDFNNAKVEFKIEWIDDCKYVLSEPRTTDPQLQLALENSKPITITIVSSWETGYKYRFQIEGSSQVLEYSATKIR